MLWKQLGTSCQARCEISFFAAAWLGYRRDEGERFT